MRSRPQPSAPCATASCASALGAGEVGEHFDAFAAGEVAVALRRVESRALRAHARCSRRARAAASSARRGRDAQHAGVGIEDQRGAVRDVAATRRPTLTSMGIPSVAGENGHMRGGPTRRQRDAGELRWCRYR